MLPVPTRIKLAVAEGQLSIDWSDGHTSVYLYQDLRDRCPCATCSEKGAGASGFLPMLGAQPLRPERVELVGRYALQIFWSDGHSAGIYTFEYLRSLCSCPQCEALRRDAGPPA